MKQTCLVLAAALLVMACPALASVGDFIRETVEIEIAGDYATVVGCYWFKTTMPPALLPILYPFPRHCYPESIRVQRCTDNGRASALPFLSSLDSSGVSFDLALEDTATVCCRVGYRQRLMGKEFTYILTSTRTWARPLDIARFIVKVPQCFRGQGINYKPDSISIANGEVTYTFSATSFWPEKDLIIRWK